MSAMDNIAPERSPENSEACGPLNARVLVIGIGNLLRKDDWVGIHVIKKLEEMEIPEGVSLLDGGTAGIDLVSYLEGIDRLIIVDALSAEGNPGEVRILSEEDIPVGFFLSGHYGRLHDVIGMAAALWKKPETTVIGIIPADCESYEIGLSPEVSPSVDAAVRAILKMVKGL